MSAIHWIFLLVTVGVSLLFTLYHRWVMGKYAVQRHPTPLTGCEAARMILDAMGVIHVSVTPVEPPHSPEEYLASEGLFLEKGICDGRDVLSLVRAARQSFLKGQLSNTIFWVHLKKKMALAVRIGVTLGWIFFLAGILSRGNPFFLDTAFGAFGVVMALVLLDLPFELEIEEKTSRILKVAGGLAEYEFTSFKKVNQAVSFAGLTCLFRAPADLFMELLTRKRR
jgi:Zn-dependent membrane protease YugP